jgi:hypothetical protein
MGEVKCRLDRTTARTPIYISVVSSRPKQPGLIGLAALSSQPGRLFDQPTTQPTQPGCGPAGKCWTVVQDSDTSRASLLYAHHSGSLINERSPGALENQKSNQLLVLRVIYIFSREFSQQARRCSRETRVIASEARVKRDSKLPDLPACLSTVIFHRLAIVEYHHVVLSNYAHSPRL